MLFVNTFITNIASVSLQIKPEIPAGVISWLIIFSLIVFILSFVFALYILVREYRKEKKQKNQTQFSTIPENNTDNTTTPSPMEDRNSIDVKPSPNENTISTDTPPSSEELALPNSRSLLSAFEAVSLPAKNVPPSSESTSLPAKPVPSPLKPKPRPIRPKPIPLPIEPPPAYYISNLKVEPVKATTGDTIFVSFTITSNTAMSDNYPVVLKVNGFEIYSNNIFLNPFESKALNYPLRAIEPGDWDIDVNNILCKLSIIEDNR